MRSSSSGIASIVVAALLTPAAHAQKEPVTTIPFEGPEIVCHVLQSLGLEPVQQIAENQLDPANTIVIVFGRPAVLDSISKANGGLRKFREKGGSLLLATDYWLQRRDLPIVITGDAIRCDSDYAYRGRTECPQLTPPWLLAPDNSVRHPIFRFLDQGIAANRPSRIVIEEGAASVVPLAAFPPYKDSSHLFPILAKIPIGYIAGSAANAPPTGRALFIAGHGMFINGMMLQKDNDNFAFTVNAIRWLREAPGGMKRKRALFVVDGKVIADFNANLYPPPALPLPSARMINRLAVGLLKEWFGDETEQIGTILIALATLALLIYGVKKLMEGRYFPDTAVPLFAGPQAATGPTEPAMHLRRQALMGRNNFWESARALIREWFRTEFDIPLEKWADGTVVQLQGTGWTWLPSALRWRAESVLRLARSSEPIKVTRRELVALVQSLSALQQAIETNRLALFVDGKEPGIAERRNAHQ